MNICILYVLMTVLFCSGTALLVSQSSTKQKFGMFATGLAILSFLVILATLAGEMTQNKTRVEQAKKSSPSVIEVPITPRK